MKREWVRPLFQFAALYDVVLGVVYFVGFKIIFARFGIAPPNHDAYVQLPAALIFVFGVGFWFVARSPERNRDIMKLGILMKLAFVGVVFGHYFLTSMPTLWLPFAAFDLVFAVCFAMALRATAALEARAGDA